MREPHPVVVVVGAALLAAAGAFGLSMAINGVRSKNPVRGAGVRMRLVEQGAVEPELPPEVQRAVARYQDLERKIEARYVSGRSAAALEAKAQALLDWIESVVSELEEAGEDRTYPIIDSLEVRLADAYSQMLTVPYERQDFDAFMRRMGPEWAHGAWQYPPLVYQIRDILDNPDADAFELIDLARDAYERRQAHIAKLRRSLALGEDKLAFAREQIQKVTRGAT